MSSAEKFLDGAAAALISGDADGALQQLKKAEVRLLRTSEPARPDIRDRLERLLSLAQAAALGISDARALIAGASTSARQVTTYDRRGEPSNVKVARPTLGRF